MAVDDGVVRFLESELSGRVERIADGAGADAAAMWLYDAAAGEFVLPVHWNLKYPDSFADDLARPLSNGFSARVMHKGELRPVSDLPTNEIANIPFVSREGVKSYVAIPLLHGDTELGILYLNYRSRVEFSRNLLTSLRAQAKGLAARIAWSGIFVAVPGERSQQRLRQVEVLRSIVNLVAASLKGAVVLWLVTPGVRRQLRVVAGTGVKSDYLKLVIDADDSIVGGVVRGAEPRLVTDLTSSTISKYLDYAQDAGWLSAAYVPVFSWGRCVGAFEVLYTDTQPERDSDFATLEKLAMVASVTIENFERSREAEEIRRAAAQLSDSPNFRIGLERIVECARELTVASAAVVVVFDKEAGTFEFEVHSPLEWAFGSCRNEVEALARQVVDSSDDYLSVSGDQLPPSLAGAPCEYRSFIGIKMPLGGKLIGVFGVFSVGATQFAPHYAGTLRMLAGQVSVALGWVHRVLEPARAVDKATARLSEHGAALEKLCAEVLGLGYEYVAVQMVRPDERTVKTVMIRSTDQSGAFDDWRGPWGHYLASDPSLRDIQADIVLKAENGAEASIEVISGWDPRFDEWIFDRFQHASLTRVYVPILVVRDEHNRVVVGWTDHCKFLPPVVRRSSKMNGAREDGVCTIYKKLLPVDRLARCHFEVIGTVEAGYVHPTSAISLQDVEQLTRTVLASAGAIRETDIMRVFETILESARQIAGADAASIHFCYEPSEEGGKSNYTYECVDGLDWDTFKRLPPRETGLGRRAVREGRPLASPDVARGEGEEEYRSHNSPMYNEGFRTTVVFPFFVEDREGVVYVHYRQVYSLTRDQEEWISLFVNKAGDAIRHATGYSRLRDSENQLAMLNTVSQSLVRAPGSAAVLREIAWSTLNMFAADVVTIYENPGGAAEPDAAAVLAGRIIDKDTEIGPAKPGTVPMVIMGGSEDIYREDARHEALLRGEARTGSRYVACFVDREEIVSACAVRLMAGDEVVGIMFVNYRRRHAFADEERRLISMLAASAASAIQTRRSIQVLMEVGRGLVETRDLTQILDLFLALCIRATRADLAEVWLADHTADIVRCIGCRSRSDVTTPDPYIRQLAFGEGLVGRVCSMPAPSAEQAPMEFGPQGGSVAGASLEGAMSVLVVPFYDSGGRVLGLINLESRAARAFRDVDHAVLDAIADHAVIAVKSDGARKALAANAALADIGVAGPTFHRCNGHAILIADGGRQIQASTVDSLTQQQAAEIVLLAEKIMTEAKEAEQFLRSTQPTAVDAQVIVEAAIRAVVRPSGVTIEHEPPDYAVSVMGTEFVLAHVFKDLLSNAFDAMPDRGMVRIGYRVVEGVGDGPGILVVHVADTGTGILPDQLEAIFERDSSRSSAHLGFGLWWARLRMRGLGGDVTVESRIGVGSTFSVVLPVAQSDGSSTR